MKKLVVVLFVIAFSAINAQNHHKLFTELLNDVINNGLVDYESLVKDSRLNKYIEQLKQRDPSEIKDKNERLAFWINAYNAFTLFVIVDNYPVESINDLHKGGLVIGQVLGTTIWHHEFIEINNEVYSLNNIEHDIIREEFNEPRIHFALVCAAMSCPPLRFEAYEGYKLDKQLEDQSITFLRNESKNKFDVDSKTAYLSKIIDWYDDDFGADDEAVLKYLASFLEKDISKDIRNTAKEWDIDYNSYDWSLNSMLK